MVMRALGQNRAPAPLPLPAWPWRRSGTKVAAANLPPGNAAHWDANGIPRCREHSGADRHSSGRFPRIAPYAAFVTERLAWNMCHEPRQPIEPRSYKLPIAAHPFLEAKPSRSRPSKPRRHDVPQSCWTTIRKSQSGALNLGGTEPMGRQLILNFQKYAFTPLGVFARYVNGDTHANSLFF